MVSVDGTNIVALDYYIVYIQEMILEEMYLSTEYWTLVFSKYGIWKLLINLCFKNTLQISGKYSPEVRFFLFKKKIIITCDLSLKLFIDLYPPVVTLIFMFLNKEQGIISGIPY